MNWSTVVKVARYHLVDRITFVAMPWAIQAFAFAVSLVIFADATDWHGQRYAGTLGAIYIMFCVLGARSISSRLPFALALGVSRRSYYAGTAAGRHPRRGRQAGAGRAAGHRAPTGWSMTLHFFRVPYLLAGPWYLTWLTSVVGLTLMFVWGMWFGLVYQRWNLIGLLTFIAAQVAVLVAALVIASRAQPGQESATSSPH
jgi:hypothetical protein